MVVVWSWESWAAEWGERSLVADCSLADEWQVISSAAKRASGDWGDWPEAAPPPRTGTT